MTPGGQVAVRQPIGGAGKVTSSAGSETFSTAPAQPAKIAAVALGISVPLVVLGKSAMAPAAALAIFWCLWQLRDANFRQTVLNLILTPLGGSVAAVLTALLISTLGSIHLSASLETWARLVAIVMFGPLILAWLGQTPSLFGTVVRGLVLLTLLGEVYVLFHFYFYDAALALRSAAGYPDAFLPARKFKMYASVLGCLLPVAAFYGWRLAGPWRLAGVATLPLAVPILLGGGIEPSFSAVAGLSGGLALAGLVAVSLRLPRLVRRGLVVGLIVLAIGAAGYIFAALPPPPVVADQVPPLPFPDWHRQVIWGFAFDVFLHNPVVGVGVNAVDMVAGAKSIIPGMNQEYIPSHPHNWVLEFAAETGVIGMTAMAVCLLTILWGFIRHAANGRVTAWPGLIFFGTFWVSALSNFSIWSAWWDISFVILLAISMVAIRDEASESETGRV